MADKAAELVDRHRLTDTLREAVKIPSVTGNEEDFSHWVQNQLQTGGWDKVWRSQAAPGQPNVYAQIGQGTGSSLLLAGHLDTVSAQDWLEKWAGTERADPFAGTILTEEMWGRGVADQKAGICMIIEAIRAVSEAGAQPDGEITALFVSDEESGEEGTGLSLGMKHAVGELWGGDATRPDFAIYTEPTTRAIYPAQMGFLIADITLEGRSAYFGTPELGVDALRAGHLLLTRFWEHSNELNAVPTHPLLGSEFLLVTEVRSGGNIAVPGQFQLSLIRKLLPGSSLDQAARDISLIAQQTATETGVQAEVSFPAGRDHPVGGTPDEISAEHPGVLTLSEVIAATEGEQARIEGAPYWSEISFLHELGIPSVYFGPGDITCCHTPYERIELTDLYQATLILVQFIARWCGLVDKQTN